MSRQKFTPGPWEQEDSRSVHVRAMNGPYVADCNASAAIDWSVKQANARLIAAAPTMYQYILDKANSGDKEAQSILESIHV